MRPPVSQRGPLVRFSRKVSVFGPGPTHIIPVLAFVPGLAITRIGGLLFIVLWPPNVRFSRKDNTALIVSHFCHRPLESCASGLFGLSVLVFRPMMFSKGLLLFPFRNPLFKAYHSNATALLRHEFIPSIHSNSYGPTEVEFTPWANHPVTQMLSVLY